MHRAYPPLLWRCLCLEILYGRALSPRFSRFLTTAPFSMRASTVRFSTAAVSGLKRKKKRKQEMYTNLVILIMWLQSTHALAWLSAGRECVLTWDGKMEALAPKENIYLIYYYYFLNNKQLTNSQFLCDLWQQQSFHWFQRQAPTTNRKKDIVNGFNSPGITLADPCTGISKYTWQRAI